MNFKNRQKHISLVLLCFSILLFRAEVAKAKIIQILHTNDTHSYLDSSTHDGTNGGAARLKSLIDYYRTQMSDQGVKSIVLDAGDFMEGNLYYMADAGRKAFQVHNEMGYDVGALGNHDYLMGTRDLDKILGEMELKFPIIAANLSMNFDYKNIREKIKPYAELEVDGIKFGILGLTTNEIFYKWRFEGGKVTNPYKAAQMYETILKNRKNDFIIALTHIGVLKDIKLAEKTKNIDLIVGGHSHTALFEPSYGINKNKHQVPIVQAGMHTEYLGRILIDVEKGRPLKIVKYELIPVKYEAVDIKMKALVEEAGNDLDNTYGKAWLDKKVGHSDLKVNDKDGSRKWAYFITDALKEKSGADIAIHTPFMNGEDYPVGDITRRDLFNSIPRVYDLTEKYGWSIYTTKIQGVWLGLVFEALTHFGQPLTFSGITMESTKMLHGIKVKHLMINGKKLNPYKFYSVAFTEGIVRGAEGVSKYTSAILKHPRNTNFMIWSTLEEKMSRNMKSMNLNNFTEENHHTFIPDVNADPLE